tara:strand:- start:614 stop:1015 length:402 start_codon:yes stop_codon:yes gene_type:complete
MPTIKNKRAEVLTFSVIAGSGNETIVIPGSGDYTHFSISIPTLANQTVTLTGGGGATDIGGSASGKLPLVWTGVDNGGSSSVTMTNGRVNMFTTSTILPGDLAITVTNGSGSSTASGFTITAMMSHSSYAASL